MNEITSSYSKDVIIMSFVNKLRYTSITSTGHVTITPDLKNTLGVKCAYLYTLLI